jgi:hypothetical protein
MLDPNRDSETQVYPPDGGLWIHESTGGVKILGTLSPGVTNVEALTLGTRSESWTLNN